MQRASYRGMALTPISRSRHSSLRPIDLSQSRRPLRTDRSIAMAEVDRRTCFKGIAALAASTLAAEAARADEARVAPLGSGQVGAPQTPSPITTGPSQTQGMARFAVRTRYEDLTAERRQRLKIALL